MNTTPSSQEQIGARRSRIIRVFNELSAETMSLVDGFYDPSVHFQDPVVDVSGRERLGDYYRGLYKNVTAIRFEFGEVVGDGRRFAAPWTMFLNARGLNGGRTVEVPGISEIVFDDTSDLVIYHRDYFDMGAFIYENIPILRQVIGFVKGRLGH